MKVEISQYEITLDDGTEFVLIRCHQPDDTHLWKILFDGCMCLNNELNFVRDPLPSSRTCEYLKSTRFPYEEAFQTILKWQEKEKNDKSFKKNLSNK